MVVVRRLAWVRVAVLACLLPAAACSAVIDPDVRGLGAPPLACEPGSPPVPCACRGGVSGTQICNAGGGYNACECWPGAAGMGGE